MIPEFRSRRMLPRDSVECFYHHALGTFGRHELREQRGSGGSDEMLGVRRRDALDERSNRHHGGA